MLFGYFPAHRTDVGANLPGQPVFLSLSYDIVAHEVTHAIVHRIRKYFLEPSNQDVLAFHEAFSDIVAIFHHFSFPRFCGRPFSRIKAICGRTRRSCNSRNSLVMPRAKEMLFVQGSTHQIPRRLETATEPHERGSVLVAAVFDAFFRTFQSRIQDLLRTASGGTGRLAQGALHPDLVNRLRRRHRALRKLPCACAFPHRNTCRPWM